LTTGDHSSWAPLESGESLIYPLPYTTVDPTVEMPRICSAPLRMSFDFQLSVPVQDLEVADLSGGTFHIHDPCLWLRIKTLPFLDSVDDIFGPVTWHYQRRPFIRALTCKTTKTRRGVAGGASSDDQVSPIFL
jgi:hypothetical protein